MIAVHYVETSLVHIGLNFQNSISNSSLLIAHSVKIMSQTCVLLALMVFTSTSFQSFASEPTGYAFQAFQFKIKQKIIFLLRTPTKQNKYLEYVSRKTFVRGVRGTASRLIRPRKSKTSGKRRVQRVCAFERDTYPPRKCMSYKDAPKDDPRDDSRPEIKNSSSSKRPPFRVGSFPRLHPDTPVRLRGFCRDVAVITQPAIQRRLEHVPRRQFVSVRRFEVVQLSSGAPRRRLLPADHLTHFSLRDAAGPRAPCNWKIDRPLLFAYPLPVSQKNHPPSRPKSLSRSC